MTRVLLLLALVLACTPDQPTTPPERWPDVRAVAAPPTADPPRSPPETIEPETAVAVQPASSKDPLGALAPKPGRPGLPGPRGAADGGCDGGRGVGESWRVECNECSCGDDGQVTCTAMACGYR